MVQQMQTTCPNCKGEGTAVDPKDRCPTCNGNRVVSEKKILEVHVEKGMKHGEKITFTREGDQHPDIKIPGDVVIVLQEKKHDVFDRNGQDLTIQKTISLKEALCGFAFPIQHLDGRILLAKSSPGELIKPQQIKCIPNEGMPKHRSPFDKGNLLIKFEVEMPESLPEEAMQILARLLPGPTRTEIPFDPAECEECYLHSYEQSANQQEANRRGGGGGGGGDSGDEDGEGGGQRAQCVHQ
jgi:DnaJ family protein A protein 2